MKAIKNIMFGLNIIVLTMSVVMMVIFIVGHILGGNAPVNQFDGFLISLLAFLYSLFNSMAILKNE